MSETIIPARPDFRELTGYKKIFEHTEPILIGLGGSWAYGTNVEGSDVDIRGIAYNPIDELYGIKNDFAQYRDDVNDVNIYSLSKMMRLLCQCNPNTIEILGLRDSDYLYMTDAGRMILDNCDLFLSKRAIYTFGNYAKAQMNRLINKSGRAKEESGANEARSISKARKHIMEHYGIELVDPSEENGEVRINFKTGNPIPIQDFCGAASEIIQIHSDYRDSRRNDHAVKHDKLPKHAMHLVRLYFMGNDILERGEINTHRDKEHDLLMAIRNGAYFEDDGVTPKKEFMELAESLETKFQEAAVKTKLPDSPNLEAVNEMVIQINKAHLG